MAQQKRRVLAAAAFMATAMLGASLWNGTQIHAQAFALSPADVHRIQDQGEAAANRTRSPFRSISGLSRATKMVIAVVQRDGLFLSTRVQTDSWVGSQDIAIAKARTAAFFSSNENALTSRIVGSASQPGGPLWGIWASNQVGITGSPSYRNGIIAFPGGVPLYKNGVLVGGVGVSGDGVTEDEAVAFAAAGYGGGTSFLPGAGVATLPSPFAPAPGALPYP